jgi:hypothetical protein
MNNSLPRLYEGMAATLAERILPHLGDDFARGQAYGLIYLLRYLQLRTGWSEAYLAPQWQALQATARRLGPLLHDLRGAPDIDSAAGAGAKLPLQARCEALLAALCTAYDWAERHADALPPEAIASIRDAWRDFIGADLRQELSLRLPLPYSEMSTGQDSAAANKKEPR